MKKLLHVICRMLTQGPKTAIESMMFKLGVGEDMSSPSSERWSVNISKQAPCRFSERFELQAVTSLNGFGYQLAGNNYVLESCAVVMCNTRWHVSYKSEFQTVVKTSQNLFGFYA